jgi:hypothetical protein
LAPAAKNETAMFDEEECESGCWKYDILEFAIADQHGIYVRNSRSTDMFDEMSKVTKEKERIQYKGYATIRTNLGNLNVELHGDRVSPS